MNSGLRYLFKITYLLYCLGISKARDREDFMLYLPSEFTGKVEDYLKSLNTPSV
jgi:hypothetical protein